MLAYHNSEKLKKKVIDKMIAHRKADELIKGRYWQDGKGCAVGCLIECSDHAQYESMFGIPQALARLEDCIFEGLPNEKAMQWPERFLCAINVGADLSRVVWEFLYWNLTENLILKDSDDEEAQEIIIQCRDAITCCADAIYPLTKSATAYAEAAYATAASAASATAYAEAAAAYAEASAATSAAYASAAASAAVEEEASAVYAAEEASAAEASAVYAAEARGAKEECYARMADKLVELLKNAI